MRYIIASTLLLTACLAACQGELPARPTAEIDVFPADDGPNYYCTFGVDGEDGFVFATLFDDPANRARMVFGGEELVLVPAEAPPAYDVAEQSILYAVENYPFYDVRLDLKRSGTEFEKTFFNGTVEMRDITTPSAPEIIASREFTGSCGV